MQSVLTILGRDGPVVHPDVPYQVIRALQTSSGIT